MAILKILPNNAMLSIKMTVVQFLCSRSGFHSGRPAYVPVVLLSVASVS